MIYKLLDGVTTASPTYGNTVFLDSDSMRTFHASVAGTGAVSATIVLQVSNDGGTTWLTMATIGLSGTTSATDGFVSQATWGTLRAGVTAISGTGATVNMSMGV